MKARYEIFLAFFLFTKIACLANLYQNIIHTESELAKVCPLHDGNVLVLSSVKGNVQQSKVSKLNKEGEPIYGNSTLEVGYTGAAEIVEYKSENETLYYLFHHFKQNILGTTAGKEYTTTFSDDLSEKENSVLRNTSLYRRTSAVNLKNGKILITGIVRLPEDSFGAHTSIDIILYDPELKENVNGFSIKTAFSNFISCYEQKENDVYCVYVGEESIFISSLKIKHLKITDAGLVQENEETLIKNFFTEYNFIKAIPFNENEALVLFQTGNQRSEIQYGNTGKDLFFYQLRVNEKGNVKAIRYEYLYNNCLYKKDPEDYNADIFVLSKNRIYAICESDEEKKFKGFIIYPNEKKIDRFNFNNFLASEVKNPVFTKFDKTLGLFYTHVSQTLNSNVAYFLINYPDCVDYKNVNISRHHYSVFDLDGNIFMSNAYPANRQNEEVKVRIVNSDGIKITNSNTNEEILLNTDFDPKIPLAFTPPDDFEGEYFIKYTATRKDPLDGLILGKTCKIKITVPECLYPCYSCELKGTEEHHLCLGCKDGFYKEDDHPTPPRASSGKIPHNCPRCNVSCSTCLDSFRSLPRPTTNCIKCNNTLGYFPFENDTSICISNKTQEYWEYVFGRAIFFDETVNLWRYCHEHCKKCEEKGDEFNNKCIDCIKDYHFFCNQTEENGGIPGTCYTGHYKNGFYITKNTSEYEYREKFCPCLDHCKECENETICDRCYSDFFLAYPNHDACVEECGYCLVEDNGECINCKNRNQFTLNGTCVDNQYDTILQRDLLIVDELCNRLFDCQEGCRNCTTWSSDQCTKCNDNYYKEDFFGLNQSETFRCFNKTTCEGVTQYKHNSSLRIGGVPIEEDGVKVCLNCRLRNDSYRQPEDDFYCGTLKPRTFIDIDEYNKLTDCYFRCKSCDSWGNSFIMNCTSCRDSKFYELIEYPNRRGYGNCYRKAHKCGIYPYYHDYDLAESLGKDEDNCGEDCDVCLYNFTCTVNFPYFVYATHECIDYCPITELLAKNCYMNNSIAGIILLRNPFGLKNPYDFINTTVDINQFISSSLFQYFASSYNIDVNSVQKEINNYLGNGQIYNLPESQIIIGNNISIELSSVKLELEKLEGLFGGPKPPDEPTPSALNISECSKILKKKYGLSDEEDLMVIKGDLLKEYNEFLGTSTEYQLFSTSLGAFLPLNDCQEKGTTVSIVNPFSQTSILTAFQSKIKPVVDNSYNPFDANSPFYNDICTPFTNENGNDVLLDARRKDYFNEKINLCDKGCIFEGYNTKSNMYSCRCNIKATPGEELDEYKGELTTNEIPEDFKDLISRRSNIEVFKCASQVFSSSGQKKNFGSYILLAGLASFIGVIVFHFVKEKTKMIDLYDNLIENKIANPPKPVSTKEDKKSKGDKKDKHEKKDEKHHKTDKKDTKVKVRNDNNVAPSKYPLSKPKNIHQDLILKDDQLNFAPYQKALERDKRTFIRYYWSLLKMKQLCIFTFYTSEDYILRSTKIVLFILFISFYLAFTALFFNDNIMRAIYIYKGNTDAAVHIPNIILSSLCCLIMSLIVRFVSLNERDITKIIQSPRDERVQLTKKLSKISKIKLFVLYAVSGFLICLCWYYVAAFCAVFKNSQGNYFINALVAFIVCNLWPCVTSLIPAFLRKKALDNGASETLYKISQIISYF